MTLPHSSRVPASRWIMEMILWIWMGDINVLELPVHIHSELLNFQLKLSQLAETLSFSPQVSKESKVRP